MVYSTCFVTGKLRFVKCNSGEEKKTNGVEYFHLKCRNLDFDGKVFGETSVELAIPKFHGTKEVKSLDALKYHSSKNKILTHLIDCSGSFVLLMGVRHHRHQGDAFYVRKGKLINVPLNCGSWMTRPTSKKIIQIIPDHESIGPRMKTRRIILTFFLRATIDRRANAFHAPFVGLLESFKGTL